MAADDKFWTIWETSTWIETRNFLEVKEAYKGRTPSRKTLFEVHAAWKAGEISASGEIDGQPRRKLTSDDAYDFDITLYTRDGEPVMLARSRNADEDTPWRILSHESELRPDEECRPFPLPDGAPLMASTDKRFQSIFPDLFKSGRRFDENEAYILVRSARPYPEERVHDRRPAATLGPDGQLRMRHRFIYGMLFDRNSITSKWPASANQEFRFSDRAGEPPSPKKKRGPRPTKKMDAVEAMRKDLDTGVLTLHDLENMLEKELEVRYGRCAKRTVLRDARLMLCRTYKSRQMATNDK
jgi:hypothetical protein